MTISRRQFVVTGVIAGAGVLIGVRYAGSLVRAQESDPGAKQKAPNPLVAYVHVKPDGQVSLIVAKSEMGQGIKTGLAMVLASSRRPLPSLNGLRSTPETIAGACRGTLGPGLLGLPRRKITGCVGSF